MRRPCHTNRSLFRPAMASMSAAPAASSTKSTRSQSHRSVGHSIAQPRRRSDHIPRRRIETQSENLHCITDFHNDQDRQLDISVHFNAFEQTDEPRGTEVLYVTQADLAGALSAAISEGGELINRGGKHRSDLHFLNATDQPSVLLEVCFVDFRSRRRRLQSQP